VVGKFGDVKMDGADPRTQEFRAVGRLPWDEKRDFVDVRTLIVLPWSSIGNYATWFWRLVGDQNDTLEASARGNS
jgi:hypothetical protein